MAGGTGLKLAHQILRALADGPKNRVELLRVLGWSVHGQNKALDALLQRMRVAGLIASNRHKRGEWRIADGCHVCEACQGRGVVSDE